MYLCRCRRSEEAQESTHLQFRLPRYVKWRQHFELSCADVTMISLDFTQSEFKCSGRYGRYSYLFLCRMVHAPHGTNSDIDNQRRLRPADFPPKLLVVTSLPNQTEPKQKLFFLLQPSSHIHTTSTNYFIGILRFPTNCLTTPAFGFNGNENIVGRLRLPYQSSP